MGSRAFIDRVVLQNYRSVGRCDVKLGPLTYLVGPNGSGKSNFVDALHLVRDALIGSLDQALNERGGLSEVRRRSGGHPTHFGIRLEFELDGKRGHYAFKVGALQRGGLEVQTEECTLGGVANGPFFLVEKGRVVRSSEPSLPALTTDRLALASLSGFSVFRPIFDALTSMGFYNFNPRQMREMQKPQDGRLLKSTGENIASVIAHLKRLSPDRLMIIQEYLQTVVPSIREVDRIPIGPVETLEFKQDMAGAKHPWKFYAQNMSDGTLRALGVLTALFQGNPDFSPSLIVIEEPETALHPAASAALREALLRAAQHTQIIVTSHSPDLLDDPEVTVEQLLAVISAGGDTRIAPIDEGARTAIRERLFSAGELLRLGQLAPDEQVLNEQSARQGDLFETLPP